MKEYILITCPCCLQIVGLRHNEFLGKEDNLSFVEGTSGLDFEAV